MAPVAAAAGRFILHFAAKTFDDDDDVFAVIVTPFGNAHGPALVRPPTRFSVLDLLSPFIGIKFFRDKTGRRACSCLPCGPPVGD